MKASRILRYVALNIDGEDFTPPNSNNEALARARTYYRLVVPEGERVPVQAISLAFHFAATIAESEGD